jgi:proteasome assembly chaperone (PAC2) family protein
VLIAAFEGWNDAGESASTAVRYLAASWGAQRFATIDHEEFYVFSPVRPQVHLIHAEPGPFEVRTTRFAAASAPGSAHDVILVHGIEPNIRWRTFCDNLIGLAQEYDVELVLTLGALAAEVPHTRPVQVTGTGSDPELIEKLDLRRSRYEGPTGIVGVLHSRLAEAGIKSASLWAAVPHYVSQQPSPKATLSLSQRVADIVGGSLFSTDLEIAVSSYERQVNDMIESDEDIKAYVETLEAAIDEGDADDPDLFDIASQAERFLRDQN